MAQYILLMSAVTVTRYSQNLSEMSTKVECIVSLTIRVLFNDAPELDLVEASKTTLILVVMLVSL